MAGTSSSVLPSPAASHKAAMKRKRSKISKKRSWDGFGRRIRRRCCSGDVAPSSPPRAQPGDDGIRQKAAGGASWRLDDEPAQLPPTGDRVRAEKVRFERRVARRSP